MDYTPNERTALRGLVVRLAQFQDRRRRRIYEDRLAAVRAWQHNERQAAYSRLLEQAKRLPGPTR